MSKNLQVMSTEIDDYYNQITQKLDLIIETKLCQGNLSLEQVNCLNDRRDSLIKFISNKKFIDLKNLKLGHDFFLIEFEHFYADGKYHFAKLIQTNFIVNDWIIQNFKKEIFKRRVIFSTDTSFSIQRFETQTINNFDIKQVFYLELLINIFKKEWKNLDFIQIDKDSIKNLDLFTISFEHLQTFPSLKSFFFELNMKNIRKIEINKTKFSNLQQSTFDGLEFLEDIYLNDNDLSEIESNAFLGLNSVKILSLRGNKLTKITSGMFNGLEMLQELYLGLNKISEIESRGFQDLKNLKFLCLECNQLELVKECYFKDLKNLQSLNLNGNRIGSIEPFSFQDLVFLEYLIISNNRMFQIKKNIFNDLSVIKLDLSGNAISIIQDDSFDGLLNLRDLNLSANKIKRIVNKMFNGLINLKSLWLMYNPIDSFSDDFYENFSSDINTSFKILK
ncbi:unnamed protein product [Brachionus calyciflorus]|uniref:Insulin-like growth factor-binding complex acid labile subunit n=1 Tax=Brachionus calyciflorus TaxID=104777 RepID=A0A813T3K4_9BILA|nr:unnamed protein product [Brachionus calyciflorus]